MLDVLLPTTTGQGYAFDRRPIYRSGDAPPPPYLRIKKSPLDVVVTLWLRRLRGSGFMDEFSQRKSLKLNQYQQHVVTG